MASKCIFCFERVVWGDLGDGKRRGGDLILNRLTIGVKSTKMPPSFRLSLFRVGERHLGDAWRNLHSLERMDDILCLLRNAVFYVLHKNFIRHVFWCERAKRCMSANEWAF